MTALPHQLLWEARQLAEKHGMFIVEPRSVRGREKDTTLVLYRRGLNGAANQRLGKRKDAAAMLAWVKTFEPKTETALPAHA